MSAWLDRFSTHNSPAPSPPPQRPFNPAPKKSYVAPGPLPARPTLSATSSSLSLVSNTSLPAAARLPSSSALRNEISNTPPADVQDPLDALADLLDTPVVKDDADLSGAGTDGHLDKPVDVIEDVDFGTLSLQEFFDQNTIQLDQPADVQTYSEQSVEDYVKERSNFDDLHNSISSCDDVLLSVEKYLTSFQADLAAVSAEIETLQARSSNLNAKLENRRKVEKLLGPVIDQVTLSPVVVREIADRPISEAWASALEELQVMAKSIESGQTPKDVRAVDDLAPLVHDISDKAVERIRDYFASHIKSLRAPNINAQTIQQQHFLRLAPLYNFLGSRQPQLGGDIAQAYTNTMRWYYSSHFTRYHAALSKLKLHITDRHALLGEETAGVTRNRSASGLSHDPFNLGRRMETLHSSSNTALPLHAAEESKLPQHLETPFVALNLAIADNASFEYTFLTSFFGPSIPVHIINRHFQTMFGPVLALGTTFTRSLIAETYDALGVLLLVRLTQHLAFTLQRRKVPVLDTYINGTHMLLWPRFQLILDGHCESLRRFTASLPNRPAGSSGAAAANALIGGQASGNAGPSTAPHPITQRFAVFVQGILSLSSEAGDDEPVSNSLARLRNEFEAFLLKLGGAFGPGEKGKRDRGRLLANNYSLVLTVLGDVGGRLADETRDHFEGLREAAMR